MKRSQLKKDFEEAFSCQFTSGYMESEWVKHGDDLGYYLDDRTQSKFRVWVSAYETYGSEPLTGEYTDAN